MAGCPARIVNAGNVRLYNVRMAGQSCSAEVLQPEEWVSCNATFPITQDMLDAGSTTPVSLSVSAAAGTTSSASDITDKVTGTMMLPIDRQLTVTGNASTSVVSVAGEPRGRFETRCILSRGALHALQTSCHLYHT